MQSGLILGDTLNFPTFVDGYLPSDGWTLKFRLIPRASGSPISIVTAQDSADSTLHRAQVTAATTAAWTAGDYSWASWVEKGAEKYSVANGSITLKPDPRVASTLDTRSVARTALDNVRLMLAGKATSGVMRYQIGERHLQSYTMPELLQLEAKLIADVKREESADLMAAGLKSKRKVYVRLDRA